MLISISLQLLCYLLWYYRTVEFSNLTGPKLGIILDYRESSLRCSAKDTFILLHLFQCCCFYSNSSCTGTSRRPKTNSKQIKIDWILSCPPGRHFSPVTWQLQYQPGRPRLSRASFKGTWSQPATWTAARATPGGVGGLLGGVTHSEGNAVRPLPYACADRFLWLVSIAVIDRGSEIMPPLPAWEHFALSSSRPRTALAVVKFLR